MFTLSSIAPTFAQSKKSTYTNIDIKSLVSENIDSREEERIQQDISILDNYGQNIDNIEKIDIGESENIYTLKFSNGVNSKISNSKHANGINQLSITEGDKHDTIFIKNGEVYLDDKKVEISASTEEIETSEDNIPVPLADRDSWSVKYAPYGSSSDYSKLIGTRTCASITLSKAINSTTQAALITILFSLGGGEFGLAALATAARRTALESIALTIIQNFTSTQGKSKYLSSKTYIYYHKNGNYISSKNMYVQKNNTRWYYGRYTQDKDKGPVSTNYVCTRYY